MIRLKLHQESLLEEILIEGYSIIREFAELRPSLWNRNFIDATYKGIITRSVRRSFTQCLVY